MRREKPSFDPLEDPNGEPLIPGLLPAAEGARKDVEKGSRMREEWKNKPTKGEPMSSGERAKRRQQRADEWRGGQR